VPVGERQGGPAAPGGGGVVPSRGRPGRRGMAEGGRAKCGESGTPTTPQS